MANYELLLIINPSLSETERDSSLDNLKTLFKKAKVKIEKEDVW
jgi:ribosomal protein S6